MNALLELYTELTGAGAVAKRWGLLHDGTPWVELSPSTWVEKPQNYAHWELHHSGRPSPQTFVTHLTLVAALDSRYRKKKVKKRPESRVNATEPWYNRITQGRSAGKKDTNMSTKTSELNVSTACSKLLTKLGRTRNLRALGFIVRTVIARRDVVSGKKVTELELDLTKITEKKSRDRLVALLADIEALTERKDLSVLCGRAIVQRKLCRAKADS